MTWPLHEARRRFSELVQRALRDGPQVVTRRGHEAVMVISIEEYRRLVAQHPDFKTFLLTGPRWPELHIERSRE